MKELPPFLDKSTRRELNSDKRIPKAYYKGEKKNKLNLTN